MGGKQRSAGTLSSPHPNARFDQHAFAAEEAEAIERKRPKRAAPPIADPPKKGADLLAHRGNEGDRFAHRFEASEDRVNHPRRLDKGAMLRMRRHDIGGRCGECGRTLALPQERRYNGSGSGVEREGASMIDYSNKTALVTGASSGIGRAIAIELARRGARVVLAARSADRLEAAAAQIRSAHGVDARPLAVDLSVEAGPDRAFDAVRKMGLDVDVLVNNAGFGSFGFFESLPLEREHREIMVNVVALARLTHLAVPGMLARGGGVIMNVASTAAFQPLPYMATYAATKAFVLSFTEALWAEYRNRGIRVLAVCPGATDTDFFNVVGTEQAAGGKKRPVEGVVRGAFLALERNKTCFIDGGRNWFQAHLIRIAPRKAVVSGAAAVMYPKE
jgi:uncharacterized protein